MKVVHLSTSVSNASANLRLHKALLQNGIESSILVQGKSSGAEHIEYAAGGRKRKLSEKTIGRFLRLLIRRWHHLPEEMPFSHGLTGTDVSRSPLVREADIIHLHWICNYQSIRSVQKLIATGKVIVWTCHDSWPFTGGCHVRYGCDRYMGECGKCPIIDSNREHDLTRYIYRVKRRSWKKNNITFIAPSVWMKENINKSSLFSKNRCVVIPNTIDLDVFRPLEKNEIWERSGYQKDEEKIHLLFGAESVTTPYKGFRYLIEALEKLRAEQPKTADRFVLHIIGAKDNCPDVLEKYQCVFWGFIREPGKMAAIYNIADIYIYPSIDDNLPNMVMESLACATPVVAFGTGGITDMVEHKKNGYVAGYRNVEELKEGILWICNHNLENCLGKSGRSKVEKQYNYQVIAGQHIALYTELLKEKNEAEK